MKKESNLILFTVKVVYADNNGYARREMYAKSFGQACQKIEKLEDINFRVIVSFELEKS